MLLMVLTKLRFCEYERHGWLYKNTFEKRFQPRLLTSCIILDHAHIIFTVSQSKVSDHEDNFSEC